jgi:hypothetical protein
MSRQERYKQAITGATEIISKTFRRYVSNIPGKQEVNELQKAATLDTAHTYFGKYYCASTKHSMWEIELLVPYIVTTHCCSTMYLRNMVRVRYVTVSTLHIDDKVK